LVAHAFKVLERFVFRLHYRDRSVTLALREGFVKEEFKDGRPRDGPARS